MTDPCQIARYRTGNRNPRNLYAVLDNGDEVHVGCMFDPEDGPAAARALTAALERGDHG